jgi:hypothetical protein
MPKSLRSRGFSLILSLTVMAGVVMLVITLSAFITIESRAAMNQQLATRARLNSLASMRLALAHLQQEAGADRRSTARAEITQPGVGASALKNPMWTGVWRTDKPDLPPAWLVSGRGDQPAGTQSVSLFQPGSSPDYHAGYWAPWQTPPTEATQDMVDLVGQATATPAAGGKPSGLVSLPKVALPDDDTFGRYAYWIGDEGIKARINLPDGRSAAASAADRLIALRSPVVAGLTGLKGLDELLRPEELGALDAARQLPLLAGFNAGAATDPDPVANPEKTYFHDLSFVSAGVIADSFHGGLRRDLSRAFELSDDDFAKTEFGEGRDAAGGGAPDGAAGTHTENGFAGRTLTNRSDDPLLMAIVTGTTGSSGGGPGNGATVAAPVFNRTTVAGQLRGPAWWALRDYHRLYKQLGWSAGAIGARGTGAVPELRARTFWPNAAVSRPTGNPEDSGLHDNGIRNRAYSYSDVYNADLPSPINPNASDFLNGDKGRLVTRPLHVAATPYVHRVSLAFSFSKSFERVPAPKPFRGFLDRHSLFLNVTPVVVVHNPYNVRMIWQPTSAGSATTDAYPAVVCLSSLEGWELVLRQDGSPAPYRKPLPALLRTKGRSAEQDDTFRIYLRGDINNPNIALEPGELRVFSCQPVAANLPNISAWTQSSAATNQLTVGRALEIDEIIYSEAGGSYDYVDETSTFTAEISPGPSLRMRHALDSWPGDRLELKKDGSRTPNDELSFFLNSSEHSELVITQGSATPAGRMFLGMQDIPFKYQNGSPNGPGATGLPAPFAVVDIAAKTANADRAPFPLFTHSNPMAGSLRASGAGRTAAGANNGARGAPASFSVNVRSCDSWGSIIQQPDNQRAFGGYSVRQDKGQERVVLTEVPLAQPTSLAQYAHANFGVRDQQPLLSVGNSFASPLVAATKTFQDNGASWTEFDQTYLLNAALWDGFFLSSLAPWMKTDGTTPTLPEHPAYRTTNGPSGPAPDTSNEAKPLAQVIEDFVLKGTPLDNPRFSLERSGTPDETIVQALDDYRRTASVLLNQGAFNVNSTSVDAWKAFLGTTKQNALQGLAASSPAATHNARFLRAVTRLDAVPATANAEDDSNWQGFANLSDAQIEKLAKAIVAENKARFALSVRGERDLRTAPGARRFGGHDQTATPYLSLAEFVNRFLCTQEWANRCGALQAAIFRADADESAGLSDRLYNGLSAIRLNAGSLSTPETTWFRHPDNIEVGNGGRVHTALAAPGNLLQSDLLQSLGSALATRSDTFTLRCFGEAILPSGETGVAWMEVVVQRTPEFIDRTNPAETGSSAPKPLEFGAPTSTDPTTNRNLSVLNHILGRRFKVTSMRWLKADEI